MGSVYIVPISSYVNQCIPLRLAPTSPYCPITIRSFILLRALSHGLANSQAPESTQGTSILSAHENNKMSPYSKPKPLIRLIGEIPFYAFVCPGCLVGGFVIFACMYSIITTVEVYNICCGELTHAKMILHNKSTLWQNSDPSII